MSESISWATLGRMAVVKLQSQAKTVYTASSPYRAKAVEVVKAGIGTLQDKTLQMLTGAVLVVYALFYGIQAALLVGMCSVAFYLIMLVGLMLVELAKVAYVES